MRNSGSQPKRADYAVSACALFDTCRNRFGRAFQYIYIASTSAVTAGRYLTRVRNRCDAVGLAPNAGKDRSTLRPHVRSVPFESSAEIFYLVEEDQVVITNIFFRGQDYDALMLGPE